MTVMEIRSAELEDAGDLLSIYRPIVEKTATSFELTPPYRKRVR